MTAAPVLDEIALPGARAVFSTRRGGVSEGPYESLNLGLLTDDDPANVLENRRRLAGAAGAERVVAGYQVHGAAIHEWDGSARDGFLAPADDPPRVDGHVTAAAGLCLLVFVADCFPVALSDGRQAAMLHCGWRPLAGGIVEDALARFEETPAAAVGPGIGPCCYEVGPEVLERFADVEGASKGRMLDIRAAIVATLRAAGVTEIAHVDRCTSCEPDRYFSHRRDRGVTGRQAGLVVLDG